MRLTLKITIAILLGVALLFSIHSYLSIQRERAELKERLSREARHLGTTLRNLGGEIWRSGGERAALAFFESSNIASGPLRVRWVWLDRAASPRTQPQIPLSKLEALQRGESLSLLAESQDGHDYLLPDLPLASPQGRLGAIELSESLDELHGYVEESLRRSAWLLVATVGSGLLLMTLLGSLWINRPVRRLSEQARRIGSGDFSTAVTVSGRDELAALGQTIDGMRQQLADAREAEQAATREKFDALEKLRHTERLATLGRLSAGMAHELGTPLNVISGRARLIADPDLPSDEVTRSARIIDDQAERMTVIMRQLLDFARRGTARKESVELAAVIRSVVDLLAPTARKQGVTLRVTEELPAVRVEADPGQIQQVLLNLALNGIQAMSQGGELQLDLLSEAQPTEPQKVREGSWCALMVRDQGEGIAPEHLTQIFDPFFTTKDVGQGTGLGLSIAYGIVEEHGGKITVESTPQQGSCFTITLPRKEAA